MEEILGTEKDLIVENTIRLLKDGDYSFSNRASQDIDLDRSWTKKSIIEEMVRYHYCPVVFKLIFVTN